MSSPAVSFRHGHLHFGLPHHSHLQTAMARISVIRWSFYSHCLARCPQRYDISRFAAYCLTIDVIFNTAALVGYETITVFQSNPNVVQRFWYDHFMPYRVPKPGSLCAPHVFNVGDTFTTDNTIFAWSLQSIEKASAGASGVTYNGSVLNNCDVNGVYLTGDLRMWTVDYSVLISCRSSSGVFDVSGTTSFSISSLPGKLAPLLGYQRAVNAQTDGVNTRAIILDRVSV